MGGYDFIFQYARYTSWVPAPGWTWLFTSLPGLIPYPTGWYVWVVLSVLMVGVCTRLIGGQWWAALISGAMLFNVWLGQVEGLVLAGVVLGWFVIERKMHPAWMGLAWLLMLIKPQAAALAALLLAFWLWHDLGWRAVGYAVAVAMILVLLSVMLWPSWPCDFITTVSKFHITADFYNATIWPWGLPSLILLALPRVSRMVRLRLALAANLLVSPYFALYHTLSLMAVAGGVLGTVASWAVLSRTTLSLAWLVPIGCLADECLRMGWARLPEEKRRSLRNWLLVGIVK